MSEQGQLNEMVQEAPARRGLARRLVDRLFSPWMKDINTAPFDWQQDAHRAFVEQQPLRARALLYVIALIVIGLVVWASLAKIDEVTRGQGKVIPSRQVQVIQSQDGGVVTEILVREGDLVTKGQLLVSLDQTRSQSSFRENRAEYQALAVKIARLTAVVDKTEFRPDPSLVREAVPGIVNQEQALYESSQAELGFEKADRSTAAGAARAGADRGQGAGAPSCAIIAVNSSRSYSDSPSPWSHPARYRRSKFCVWSGRSTSLSGRAQAGGRPN